MEINLTLTGTPTTLTVRPNELLMHALRRQALFSVKHGCETGECGACIKKLERAQKKRLESGKKNDE